MNLTDTHCHLYLNQFEDDLPAVLERAWQNGVQFILIPGLDIETSKAAIALAETDDRIFAAVGFHPNSANDWDESSLDNIRHLADHPKVIAIGEIGLDYYRDTVARQQQMTVFRQQIQLAAELGLPLVLHNRQASDDLYPILLEWQNELFERSSKIAMNPGVLHAFNEDHKLVESLVQANYYFGIGGPVTFLNAAGLSALVVKLPLDRIVLETDAPFLPPHPFRGQRNEPGYTLMIAEKIAAVRSMNTMDVSEATYDNATRLFSWR